MLQAEQIEALLGLIGRMDRATIACRLNEVRANFPVDFTAEFVESTDLDRLRHIYLALCLQTQHMPGETETMAA